MQQLIREKKYKARDPYDTIDSIRQILRKNHIYVSDKNSKESGTTLFSSRVKIDEGLMGDLEIGSNGKGLSAKYSLASAYSEFMERLQNGVLIEQLKFATNEYMDFQKVGGSYRERITRENLGIDFINAQPITFFYAARNAGILALCLFGLFTRDSKVLLSMLVLRFVVELLDLVATLIFGVGGYNPFVLTATWIIIFLAPEFWAAYMLYKRNFAQ